MELGALLGIIIAGVIGIFTYAWQDRIKRNTTLAERRKELYEELLRNLFELLIAKTGSDRSLLISEIEKSWLFASDNVLDACYKYLKIYDDYYDRNKGEVLSKIIEETSIRKKFENGIANLFLQMRYDIKGIGHTKIDDDWSRSNVKIYDWGIISKLDSAG